MKPFIHPVFLISASIFLLNQALEYQGIFVYPLYTYLDDLLCLPITLTIVLAIEQQYFNDKLYRLPWHYTFISVLLFSLFFEGVLPLISSRYIADVLDIPAYAVGAIIFHFSINNSVKSFQN
jgi:hypothetical protein